MVELSYIGAQLSEIVWIFIGHRITRLLVTKGLMLLDSHFRSFNMAMRYQFNCQVID